MTIAFALRQDGIHKDIKSAFALAKVMALPISGTYAAVAVGAGLITGNPLAFGINLAIAALCFPGVYVGFVSYGVIVKAVNFMCNTLKPPRTWEINRDSHDSNPPDSLPTRNTEGSTPASQKPTTPVVV